MEKKKSWYLDGMRPLAWVETVLKLLAFAAAGLAGAEALGAERGPAWPEGWLGPAGVLLAGLLLLGLVAGIYDRLLERELFAFVFIFANIAAHAAVLYALLVGIPHAALLVFLGLMLAGDVVKLIEIRRYHMQVREFDERTLYKLTGFYIGGYLLLTLLVVLGH